MTSAIQSATERTLRPHRVLPKASSASPTQRGTPGDEARTWWRSMRRSTQDALGGTLEPDTEGRTYAAVLWRAGEDKLLGFEAFC